MERLNELARMKAAQQRMLQQQYDRFSEQEASFYPAKEALLGVFSCMKASVDCGEAMFSRLWPTRSNPDEIDEIDVVGPWVQHDTSAGPLFLRIKASHRDIKLPDAYLHRSATLETKHSTPGLLVPRTEVLGKIWCNEGKFVSRHIQIGENYNENVDPTSDEAFKFYETLKQVAIDSVI